MLFIPTILTENLIVVAFGWTLMLYPYLVVGYYYRTYKGILFIFRL